MEYGGWGGIQKCPADRISAHSLPRHSSWGTRQGTPDLKAHFIGLSRHVASCCNFACRLQHAPQAYLVCIFCPGDKGVGADEKLIQRANLQVTRPTLRIAIASNLLEENQVITQ